MHAKCKLLLTGKSSMFVCNAILVMPQVHRAHMQLYVIGPVKIDHLSTTKSPISFVLALNNYLYYYNQIFATTAQFNGLSSAACRNGILHSKGKICTNKNRKQCNLCSHDQFS